MRLDPDDVANVRIKSNPTLQVSELKEKAKIKTMQIISIKFIWLIDGSLKKREKLGLIDYLSYMLQRTLKVKSFLFCLLFAIMKKKVLLLEC